MKCPRCQSDNTRKDGHANGKQRWECKDCGRIFRNSYSTKGYHPQVKQIWFYRTYCVKLTSEVPS